MKGINMSHSRNLSFKARTIGLLVGGAAALASLAGAGVAIAGPPPPSVTSVSMTGYPTAPVVTVTGTDFGSRPTGGVSPATLSDCRSGTGVDYPNSQLWALDASRSDGLSGAFEEGELFTSSDGNCGGDVIRSWSATKAVFSFGSRYASDPGKFESGDVLCVDIKSVPACTKLA